MSLTDFQDNFRLVVEKIFNNWQNLRLAVEHGMGGQNGVQTAIQIVDYVYQYCVGNEHVTQGELKDVIEDLMDQEFDTLCDDYSITEIARNLLRYKQMCLEGQYVSIESELSKLCNGNEWLRSDAKYAVAIVSDSSDESSIGEDDMDVDMNDDKLKEEASPSCRGRIQTQKQENEIVEDEPGWTTVRGKRK